MDNTTYVIEVYEDVVDCSCGYSFKVRKPNRVFSKVFRHGFKHPMSIVIVRIGCSKFCIDEKIFRDPIKDPHDFDCPNYTGENKDA